MKTTVLLLTTVLFTTTILAQFTIKKQTGYGGTDWESLNRMCVTKDSGLILGGFSTSDISGNKTTHNKGSWDYWIIKQDKTGAKKWEQDIGGSGIDNLHDIKATKDGGYILAGSSASPLSGDKTEDSQSDDYWMVKVDNLGRIQWDKTLGGSSSDIPFSIEQTTDSGYIVAGHSYSPISGDKTESQIGGDDIWLVKLNKNGALQWQKTIGGSGEKKATGMVVPVVSAWLIVNKRRMAAT